MMLSVWMHIWAWVLRLRVAPGESLWYTHLERQTHNEACLIKARYQKLGHGHTRSAPSHLQLNVLVTHLHELTVQDSFKYTSSRCGPDQQCTIHQLEATNQMFVCSKGGTIHNSVFPPITRHVNTLLWILHDTGGTTAWQVTQKLQIVCCHQAFAKVQWL